MFTVLKWPPQISVQHNTFEMWWQQSCTCKIYTKFLATVLSCQYGPKSVRDVSSTLLNLRRQKGVQPKTGSVTNKVTVNTYFYISSALERSKPVTGNYQDVDHSHESHASKDICFKSVWLSFKLIIQTSEIHKALH